MYEIEGGDLPAEVMGNGDRSASAEIGRGRTVGYHSGSRLRPGAESKPFTGVFSSNKWAGTLLSLSPGSGKSRPALSEKD